MTRPDTVLDHLSRSDVPRHERHPAEGGVVVRVMGFGGVPLTDHTPSGTPDRGARLTQLSPSTTDIPSVAQGRSEGPLNEHTFGILEQVCFMGLELFLGQRPGVPECDEFGDLVGCADGARWSCASPASSRRHLT